MELTEEQRRDFRRRLHKWHDQHNSRQLPWKGEKDPYKIWLSEIILQQTRAQQGLPYYMGFITTYPDVRALATAADEDVFRLWQGLGYYNRCKNMLATARYVARELGGVFPASYHDIAALRGIGPYTAAAIASFAFGLPHAVVDGNVYRVLSRFLGIDTPFDVTAGKKIFAAAAQQMLDENRSAAHNQAIMDLGATICTPAKPLCGECPLQGSCFAYAHGLQAVLPVRSKKTEVRERYFHYVFVEWNGLVWIQKRGSGDIWENLHQPCLVETKVLAEGADAERHVLNALPALAGHQLLPAGKSRQRLTHQLIHAQFYIVRAASQPFIDAENGIWLSVSELKKLAFPKTLVSFLKNKLYF